MSANRSMAMLKKKNTPAPDEDGDGNARLVTSDEEKTKANKWFSRARELGDKRQFDHAIEYYVSGLEFWPDAVEVACKPLHGCAVARRSTGGKKPGLKDTMKRSVNDKDARKAFINSLWLFGRDPANYAYLEALAKNASRLKADDAAKWACGVCYRGLDGNPKASAKQYSALARLLEEVGDRAITRSEPAFAADALTTSVEVVRTWLRRFPKDNPAEIALKEISTKLTILKGKYQDGESFRESMRDAEEQRDLHDEHRTVQKADRVLELIDKAEADYRENPDQPGKLNHLVDLLCRRDDEKQEANAMKLLLADFERTDEYGFKQRADDIQMKQLARPVRVAAKAGDEKSLKAAQIAQLRFELGVFGERTERFPTDQRIKFEFAVRCFRAGQVDEAIPMFQSARGDPKNRAACGLFLGRCFFKKGYHSQAVSTLVEAISEHDYPDDETAKSLKYWLGRAQEAAGEVAEAEKTYGNLLQVDYNYRDVRARLDGLRQTG